MERKEGYYWVKYIGGGDWQVAEWTGKCWFMTEDTNSYSDLSFHKINETPIPQPND